MIHISKQANRLAGILAIVLAMCTAPLPAAGTALQSTDYGPYNAEFIAGGAGLLKPLMGFAKDATIAARSPFTLYTWVRFSEVENGRVLIAGLRNDNAGDSGIYLGVYDHKLGFWTGPGNLLLSPAAVAADKWYLVAVVSDGRTVHLFLDGTEVAQADGVTPAVMPVLLLAPRKSLAEKDRPFAGRIAGMTVTGRVLAADQIRQLQQQRPDFPLINYEAGSPGWSVQTRQMVGQTAPQDAWTLPKGRAPFSTPVARPAPLDRGLQPDGTESWKVSGWQLQAAPRVHADGATISKAGFDTTGWYTATVPGTVLTTLVNRGVYPDPDYGLNNMAIPESLNKQDYWYRSEFKGLEELQRRRLLLTFNGINYAAEVWLNGWRLGDIKGAFVRGQFDVSGILKPGQVNVIAVRVSPPPHPGIPHEQSISAGAGNNGGMLALDGPTFIASEGWDWIPAVRDRNTGLWQDVVLRATGSIRIQDIQVVTTLPKPDNSVAEIEINVPLENLSRFSKKTTLHIRFDDVSIDKKLTLPSGSSTVKLTAGEFPELRINNPRLWWPNGYGDQNLHRLKVEATEGRSISDRSEVSFGIRQITYEISLLDRTGHLRRVEVDLSAARDRGEEIIDVHHKAMRRLTADRWGSWAASFVPGAASSPAVTLLADDSLTPNLVIKVNGVRIAARGGNWGMDDWRKRVSRERLEPYFRLHKLAHFNIIRNWVGQNTEQAFYQLADKYGMLVVNGFWASTQNFQLEPEDVPLFLNNAAEVIKRFRNHPSITLWVGRNEGVPQPVLNEGLDRLVKQLDGTRHYSPTSLLINLALGGPYNHRRPAFYYNYWGKGFSMEVGLPSFPTLEAFRAFMPPQEWWPIGDAWAYHDWHQGGNGDTKSFMQAMANRFGPATDLEDFVRKAQLLNYEAHRAVFEGMNAELWHKNSGRLLWMSQSAWPSTVWQVISHDYDTNASFYGAMHACEPVHVQMDLPDHRLAVINNTNSVIKGAVIRAAIYTLAGEQLLESEPVVDAAANAVTDGPKLDLDELLQRQRALLVKLRLEDATGKALSQNLYWLTHEDGDGKLLAGLPQQPVALTVSGSRIDDEVHLTIGLRNNGTKPALDAKLTLLNPDGTRILPAYYDDNYISLLPGESREVGIVYPADKATGIPSVALRGWNVIASSTTIDSLRNQ